jgi:hypothetical protein
MIIKPAIVIMNISFKDPRVPETLKKMEMMQMKILPPTQMYLNAVSY